MPERHPFVLFLSCFTSTDNAVSIHGDIIEVGAEKSMLWRFLQYSSLLFAFFRVQLIKKPLTAFKTALVSIAGCALVTCFLLVPFSLVHIDVQVLPLMIAVLLFRFIACFLVAAVIADMKGVHASAGLISAACWMFVVLMLRLYALESGVWLPSSNLMGPVQHLLFYIPCSALAIVAGCVYGLACRHYRDFAIGQVA